MSVDNSLIIEILKSLRSDNSTLRTEMRAGFVDIATRLTRVELGIAAVRREGAIDAESIAHQQVYIDRIHARLDRIERRLELVDDTSGS